MLKKLMRTLVVMAAAALIPAARYAFAKPLPRKPTDETCLYLLVGGPFDGRKEEDWVGAQQIQISMASVARDPDSARGWANYRRNESAGRGHDGLVQFHFSGITQEYFG